MVEITIKVDEEDYTTLKAIAEGSGQSVQEHLEGLVRFIIAGYVYQLLNPETIAPLVEHLFATEAGDFVKRTADRELRRGLGQE